jgi:hypothetical protein
MTTPPADFLEADRRFDGGRRDRYLAGFTWSF